MRNAMTSLAVAACISATGALADYAAGDFTGAETRFGSLQVVGARGYQQMLFNGVPIVEQDHAYSIDGVWAVSGGASDWAVIRAYHGGNMCGGFEMMIVRLSAGQAAVSPALDICGGQPEDIRLDAGAVELDITDPSVFVAYRVFRFDGAELNVTEVEASPAMAAGAGADVTRWLDRHPINLTQDPREHARFASIMGPVQMEAMNSRMTGPGRVEQRGNWIVGAACQAHSCGFASAAWALRITDGTPVAVFYDEGNTTLVFNAISHSHDPVIAQLLEGPQF